MLSFVVEGNHLADERGLAKNPAAKQKWENLDFFRQEFEVRGLELAVEAKKKRLNFFWVVRIGKIIGHK